MKTVNNTYLIKKKKKKKKKKRYSNSYLSAAWGHDILSNDTVPAI